MHNKSILVGSTSIVSQFVIQFSSHLGIVLLEDAQAVSPKDREHTVLEAQNHQHEESDATKGIYFPKDTPEGTCPTLSVTGGSAVAILMRRIGGLGISCHFCHAVGIVVLVQLRVLSLLLLRWKL